MTIKYNIDDLRDTSTDLLKCHETMNGALNDLNKLVDMINSDWVGEDRDTFIQLLDNDINAFTTYLNRLQIIANNLNTAAALYEKHEETYSAALW